MRKDAPSLVWTYFLISHFSFLISHLFCIPFRAVSSVGLEHHVDNVGVAGSSPAQPTPSDLRLQIADLWLRFTLGEKTRELIWLKALLYPVSFLAPAKKLLIAHAEFSVRSFALCEKNMRTESTEMLIASCSTQINYRNSFLAASGAETL